MANTSKAGDKNPFVYNWRVSFAPLRLDDNQSIGHPFGRTGQLNITAGSGNTLNCLLDPDMTGQDYIFTATWQPGSLEGAPASMVGDIEAGNRVYRFFGYLRPDPETIAGGKILGQLERLPRPDGKGDGAMEDSDADGSWIGGDNEGGDPR